MTDTGRHPVPARKEPKIRPLITITCTLALAFLLIPLANHTNAATQKPKPRLVEGKSIEWWARTAKRNKQAELTHRQDARAHKARSEQLARRLRVRLEPLQNEYERAATLAAIAYGVDAATLIRKGRCESANWTAFYNASSGASGPWQFLASTWASTPFAAFSVFDPFAAALAAAWMHAQGRGGEWVCQ